MIKGIAIATVWVLDQDRAKDFYVHKLGLEVRTDMTMDSGGGDGDASGGGGGGGGGKGMRWLTVGAKDQPDVELTLMVPGPPAVGPESAEALKKLVAEGALGAGVLSTDDILRDYETLKARGVEFLQEPKERPYGTEAIFRDDSGNWFSLTQRNEQLDPGKAWGECVDPM
ncbi:VOC family protein [Streptomyces sp. NPDC008001]|uniref:VOC family protein n=1 Tax=Streptomyces sp. NPDC008001 TaxID=3364804 RepID=UPI0036E49A4E